MTAIEIARLVLDAHECGYDAVSTDETYIRITPASVMHARMVVAEEGKK